MRKLHIIKFAWVCFLVIYMTSSGADAAQSFKVDPVYAAEAAQLKARMEEKRKLAAARRAIALTDKEKVGGVPAEIVVIVNPVPVRGGQDVPRDPPIRIIEVAPVQNQEVAIARPVVDPVVPVDEQRLAPVVPQVLPLINVADQGIEPRVDLVGDLIGDDPVLRERKLREVVRANIALPRFAILRDANLEPVIRFFAHQPLTGNEALVFLRSFAKRVEAERRNAEHINNRVMHVRRILKLACDIWPMEAGGRQYDPVLEARYYLSALEQREQIYEYLQGRGFNILLDEIFNEVVVSLKLKLKKLPDAVLDFGFSFEKALRIAKFDEALAKDKRRTVDCFDMKQLGLNTKVDRSAGHGYYTILCGQKFACDLLKEWNLAVSEIDRIERTKRDKQISLCYQNLTYRDHYAAYFQVDYPAFTFGDSNVLRDEILMLIRANVPHDPDKPYRLETGRRVDRSGVVVDEGSYGKDPKNRLYFKDEDGEITGQEGRLFSLPKKGSDGTRLYFLAKTKEYFRTLNDSDTGNFRVRSKLLLEKAPPCMVPDDIVRPGGDHFDKMRWDAALVEARGKMAVRIICSLEGCDTGKDEKLGKIEREYQDILGVLNPEEPVIKSVAGIVRKLKLERIFETQNPDMENRFEESVTAPQVLMQRLRGPLGLLGDYMPIVAASYGRPREPQNDPLQIIRNLFEPNQPDRAYQTGPMPAERGIPDNGDWVIVPVKPCMTVKSLVEAVYGEFQSVNPMGSIKTKDICSFLNGNLDLLQDECSAAVNMRPGIFFQGLSDRNEKLFTREMAFYILEKMEYVRLDPRVKQEVYKFDHEDEPGTALVSGRRLTLKELIDEH